MTRFPHPAPAGSVPAERLAQVEELHATCRKWVDHIPQHLPYIDLTFAFGFATLGDAPRARRLLADARAVMQSPVSVTSTAFQHHQDMIAALIRNFLFQASEYRIEQALAGHPHTGPLSAELLAARKQIEGESCGGPVNNPHKMALWGIDRFRSVSHIVEPTDRVDPYAEWSKHGDALKQELAQLGDLREPSELADRIRQLYRDPPGRNRVDDSRLQVLRDSLPLAMRVGEAFAAELVGLVPEALAPEPVDKPPLWPVWQSGVLESAMTLAVRFSRGDLARQLTEQFIHLVGRTPEPVRFRIISAVAGEYLRSLRRLGLRGEIDRLLACVGSAIPEKCPSPNDPEAVVTFLCARLALAAGSMTLGSDAEAAPILDEARHELLTESKWRVRPDFYTHLARAYVSALGEGPADSGLSRVAELFREMPREKIRDSFTTAPYFSRLHLNLSEDAVAAVCRMLLEPPSPWVTHAPPTSA